MEKKKILIVEDEGIVALELKGELEAMGYAADTSGSGEEAMENIALSMPDLVLMDIWLPGKMDGTETAAWIREQYDIPVIYLTAHMDENTLKRAKATAPYSYIIKPYDIKELQIAIELALYRHKIEWEKEQLTRELKDALAKVKVLSGMLPICSFCKKIRDDQGYWKQLESYITAHSEALFSHGLCPECCRKHYPDIYEEKNDRPE